MYRDMEQWTRIRVRVKDGESKRQILRETGMHWRTLEKILSNPAPPKFGPQQISASYFLTNTSWVETPKCLLFILNVVPEGPSVLAVSENKAA